MKNVILLSLIVAPFMMVGCGGGSSTSTATATTLAKISGTVPGTLIEAFCDNNYYANVTSTNNGTNQHPFSINVPTNTNCKLVMTTNQNDPANRIITPISFQSGNSISLTQDVDLGNVPLEMNYANADDKDGDHVVDSPFNISPKGASVKNSAVFDKNGNGVVDTYDDNNDDNVVNAYEDTNHDGIKNIHDDQNGNGVPDFIETNQNGNSNDNNQSDAGNTNDNGNNNAGNSNDNNQSDAGNSNHNGNNDNNHNGNNDNNHNGNNDNNSSN